MVSAPMTLITKQARAAGIDLPIINSSSIVEPTATALFEPSELANMCAETPSAPEARATPEMKTWADAYKKRFGIEPDGLALGQYDGSMMTLQMIADGAKTAETSSWRWVNRPIRALPCPISRTGMATWPRCRHRVLGRKVAHPADRQALFRERLILK